MPCLPSCNAVGFSPVHQQHQRAKTTKKIVIASWGWFENHTKYSLYTKEKNEKD
jgi:hypothetical protein